MISFFLCVFLFSKKTHTEKKFVFSKLLEFLKIFLKKIFKPSKISDFSNFEILSCLPARGGRLHKKSFSKKHTPFSIFSTHLQNIFSKCLQKITKFWKQNLFLMIFNIQFFLFQNFLKEKLFETISILYFFHRFHKIVSASQRNNKAIKIFSQNVEHKACSQIAETDSRSAPLQS